MSEWVTEGESGKCHSVETGLAVLDGQNRYILQERAKRIIIDSEND